MIRAGIVGASGYSGAELLRLLLPRTDVRVEVVTAASSAGQRVDALYPSLAGRTSLAYRAVRLRSLRRAGRCLHLASLRGRDEGRPVARGEGEACHRPGRRFPACSRRRPISSIISTSIRPRSFLPEAVYGLPELQQGGLEDTPAWWRIQAVIPTSAILGLLPALVSGMVETQRESSSMPSPGSPAPGRSCERGNELHRGQ